MILESRDQGSVELGEYPPGTGHRPPECRPHDSEAGWRIGIGFQVNISRSQAQGFVQNLVNETRKPGLESGVGSFVLHVKTIS